MNISEDFRRSQVYKEILEGNTTGCLRRRTEKRSREESDRDQWPGTRQGPTALQHEFVRDE
jgi:hypothetical protein